MHRFILAPCFAALCTVAGCTVDEVGPATECVDCTGVVEPNAPILFSSAWLDEPCDNESKTVGPLVTFCTPVDFTEEISCTSGCEVTPPEYAYEETEVRLHDVGPATVTVRLTRDDTGEVFERAFEVEVAFADRLTLACDDDCAARDRSGTGERYVDLTLRAFRGEQPVTLDTSLLASDPPVAWSRSDDPGEYSSFIDLADAARTFTVTHAEGASASADLPSYEESF